MFLQHGFFYGEARPRQEAREPQLFPGIGVDIGVDRPVQGVPFCDQCSVRLSRNTEALNNAFARIQGFVDPLHEIDVGDIVRVEDKHCVEGIAFLTEKLRDSPGEDGSFSAAAAVIFFKYGDEGICLCKFGGAVGTVVGENIYMPAFSGIILFSEAVEEYRQDLFFISRADNDCETEVFLLQVGELLLRFFLYQSEKCHKAGPSDQYAGCKLKQQAYHCDYCQHFKYPGLFIDMTRRERRRRS